MTISERCLAFSVFVLAGCATPSVPSVRFVNAPIVWEVDDRRDVPVKPKERAYHNDAYDFDQLDDFQGA